MLRLAETKSELKVVSDQHGIPTSCVDLSFAISELIDQIEDLLDSGKNIVHFSSACEEGSMTWADFAREIFALSGRETRVIDCASSEYPTKARRPAFSILQNDSDILLPDWRIGLKRYLRES